jgi:hypothetical protein
MPPAISDLLEAGRARRPFELELVLRARRLAASG